MKTSTMMVGVSCGVAASPPGYGGEPSSLRSRSIRTIYP